MKRIIVFFLFFGSLISFSQELVNSNLFRETFIKTRSLNKERLENIDKIFIGDTILFPSLKNEGKIVACVVNKFDKNLGLYHLTYKYLLGDLITFPVDTMQVIIPIKVPEKVEEDLGILKYFNILTIFLLFGLIWLIYDRIKYWFFTAKQPEPKPLIPGGLSCNANEALKQLIAFNDTEIYRIDRGTLRGKGRPKVKMLFSTGEIKIPLYFGQMFYRVVYQNSETVYHRLTCGGKIKVLPARWYFVPDNDIESSSCQKKSSE